MSRFRNALMAAAWLAVAGAAFAQASQFPGLGREATPKEVAKWDIDVRPDFKGLPAGSGSVAKTFGRASARNATACLENRARCSAL